jgi:hypothetical protein
MSEKRAKYRNIKVVVDGVKFDSKLEAKRYGELKLLKQMGLIESFELQKRYPLEVNGFKICTYVCDFVVNYPSGKRVIEDTKGVLTADFKLKMKLMKAIYNIDIELIKR